MLGPPGAGKGTQAERFAKSRRVPRISTGDVLRSAKIGAAEVERRARALMAKGHLVEDDLVIGIVRDRLAEPDAAAGFVLDGFPRTLVQAEALDELVDHKDPLVVIDIEVPEETLLDRLQSRRVCAKCGTPAASGLTACASCGGPLVGRNDDDLRVVRERLRVYARESQPLVEFYRRRPTFRTVDGDQPLEAVAADISAAFASVVGVP
jgi:adenylate kinase